MMVLVTYDVNTSSESGQGRLRKVAKICVNFGQRVQNSVFECVVNPAQFVQLKANLQDVIDEEKDSLRFYLLGTNWERKVEMMGKNETYNPEKDTFIF